jgi:hypothetical protein
MGISISDFLENAVNVYLCGHAAAYNTHPISGILVGQFNAVGGLTFANSQKMRISRLLISELIM